MHKKVLILSDMHCGHVTGLTPPAYQRRSNTEHKWNKYVSVQKNIWKWFTKEVLEHGPYDHCIVNGDCIDGPGSRSGGSELITTDSLEQANIAIEILKTLPVKKFTMTYGTAYHTGQCEDFEQVVAKALKAKIGSHEWVTINGAIFDVKHHLSSSSIPYGRTTALSKEAYQNALWAARGEQPQADVLLRSHVHYYSQAITRIGNTLVTAVSTPALQGYGSKYGARRCSAPVDIGFLVAHVAKTKGRPTVHMIPHLAQLDCLKARSA